MFGSPREPGSSDAEGLDAVLTGATPQLCSRMDRSRPSRCGACCRFGARRASKVKPYDFRHSVATELTERSGNLLGVGYLLGHRHVTTTNQYVHARRRAAESVLSGRNLGQIEDKPEARWNTADTNPSLHPSHRRVLNRQPRFQKRQTPLRQIVPMNALSGSRPRRHDI